MTDKTFPSRQIREYVRKHAPKPIDMQGPHVIPQLTKYDLYWIAYQRGFRDGRRKERES